MDSFTNFSPIISPAVLKKYVEFWINEDIPSFDLSTLVVSNEIVNANIEMKEAGILAGLPFVEEVLKYFECEVDWQCEEGFYIDTPTVVGIIKGQAHKVLMAERTVLNILSRSCGVATIANKISLKLKPKWKGEVCGNRKTTPGFRIVEKYAMFIGGIYTHRYDLSTMTIVKDNHIAANGSIKKCIEILKSKVGKLTKIEVECSNLNDALEATKSGADIIMLDNLKPHDVRSISKQVKNINSSVLIEASGGIKENNIMDYANDNVDIISSSLFSQGYKCIDISINTITSYISPVSEISESVIVNNNIDEASKVEILNEEKHEEASTIVSNNDSIDKEKTASKRKLEDGSEPKIEAVNDKTDANKAPETSDNKITSPIKPAIKSTPTNKPVNKYDPTMNKQRKMNPNGGKVGQAIYNLQTVGSVRMPGQPVRYDSKGQLSNRASIDNQANFIRTVAANLASFMNPNAMRFGGPITRVPFMNNIKLFCKVCNFQNQNNGHPFCQNCRKKLE